jgi:hypothetical protein
MGRGRERKGLFFAQLIFNSREKTVDKSASLMYNEEKAARPNDDLMIGKVMKPCIRF